MAVLLGGKLKNQKGRMGEYVAISALVEQLPTDCTIIHSADLLNRETMDFAARPALKESEVDAVVLWPGKGMLVIEIKGGHLASDSATGRLVDQHKNNSFLKKEPFSQARQNMHVIVDKFTAACKESDCSFDWDYGYAVMMPFSHLESMPVLSGDRELVCDKQKMGDVKRFVASAINHFKKGKKSYLPEADVLAGWVTRGLEGKTDAGAVVEADNAILRELTQLSYETINAARENRRISVKGVAGSGKTWIAIKLAEHHAKSGRKVLLLCFNLALAAHLSKAVAKLNLPITALSFHQLCRHTAELAGIPYIEPQDSEAKAQFYNIDSAELLIAYAAEQGISYDAIVVDEGQDMREDWWDAIESCLAVGGYLAVFHDAEQDLNQTNSVEKVCSDATSLLLERNCRNTRLIAEFCGGLVPQAATVTEATPEGHEVRLEVECNTRARKRRICNIVDKWLRQPGINPSQIAILSPWRPQSTSIGDASAIGDTLIVNDTEDWFAGKGVLHTTIRAFKGLEADYVVLADIVQPDSHKVFSSADYYVGASRARHQLWIVAKESLIEWKGAA